MENNFKKQSIGILLPPRKGNGGIFQFALSIAEALINYCDDYNYTIVHFEKEGAENIVKIKAGANVRFITLDTTKNPFSKLGTIASIIARKPLFVVNKENKKLLRGANLDLIILPAPQVAGFQDIIPYILPIPDMNYKYYQKDSPELSSLKSRIISHIIFNYMARHARLCVADSVWGKKDIMNFYDRPEDRVEVIPFIPPGYVYAYKDMTQDRASELLAKYNLPEQFLFYPAQFWPHKNHARLIESVGILKEKFNTKVNLVLAGNPKADPNNYSKVEEMIQKFNLKDQISILGYIPDEEVVALYKKCLALVFPTFAGPTNIPLVEAMVLGVPVLSSNAFAMPEQVGEAGMLFNPADVNDMVEKIRKVWQDEDLRKSMIEKGHKQVTNLTAEHYASQWIKATKKALNFHE